MKYYGSTSNQNDFSSVAKISAEIATELTGTGQIKVELDKKIDNPATKASGQILEYDGTAWVASDKPVTADMTGATQSTAGTHGLAPAPSAGDQAKFLRGDATWAEVDALPSQTGHSGKYLTTNGTTASWTALSTIAKYVTTITGDGSTTQFPLNHDLNTRDVIVEVYDNTTYATAIVEVTRTSTSQVTIEFNEAPVNAKVFRVLVAPTTVSGAIVQNAANIGALTDGTYTASIPTMTQNELVATQTWVMNNTRGANTNMGTITAGSLTTTVAYSGTYISSYAIDSTGVKKSLTEKLESGQVVFTLPSVESGDIRCYVISMVIAAINPASGQSF